MLRSLVPATALLLIAAPVAAQVGSAPTASPYHDIRMATAWELAVGSIKGSGGPVPVGPRDGSFASFRALIRAENSLSLGLGIWASRTQRTVLNPNVAPEDQVVGTRDAHLLGGELLVQLNLTGGKRWHRLAPFLGVGVGVVRNTSGDEGDPGGYEFGTKFYFAPLIGTRLFLADRLYLRAEARGYAWKLKYPLLYGVEPTQSPGTADDPHAIDPVGHDGQYAFTPALSVGIGIAF